LACSYAAAIIGAVRHPRKSRSIITADEVPVVFDDACVAELAKMAKLPPDADMDAFAKGLRDAARIFARDARIPTDNELHDEISKLHKAAAQRRCDHVAGLLERLSPEARKLLQDRGRRPSIGVELPSVSALRDPSLSGEACQRIVRLCQFGGCYIEGRRLPSGKRSRPVWSPHLYAPKPQRNPPKREAERILVIWLQIAWCEATGALPPLTARHPDESRDLGPFARLVRDCLRLVGARDANVVELINELHRRRKMEREQEQ
jgi:hypothetical protein